MCVCKLGPVCVCVCVLGSAFVQMHACLGVAGEEGGSSLTQEGKE